MAYCTVQRSCIAADEDCVEAMAIVGECIGRASGLGERKEIVPLEEGTVSEERSKRSRSS